MGSFSLIFGPTYTKKILAELMHSQYLVYDFQHTLSLYDCLAAIILS